MNKDETVLDLVLIIVAILMFLTIGIFAEVQAREIDRIAIISSRVQH